MGIAETSGGSLVSLWDGHVSVRLGRGYPYLKGDILINYFIIISTMLVVFEMVELNMS